MNSVSEENSPYRPKRREGIEAIPMYHEVVLFDSMTGVGISLNPSARQIWDLADGTRTISTIVDEIGEKLGIRDDSEAMGELDFDVRTTLNQFQNHKLVRMLRDDRTFHSHDDMPTFSQSGFEVIDLPEEAWHLIKSIYSNVLERGATEEDWGDMKEQATKRSELYSMDLIAEKRDRLYPMLQAIHEKWCGEDLDPAAIYGIRSYLKGADLFQHKDTIGTHHISSIVMVDKDLSTDETGEEFADDWALDIQAHDGSWHQVYLQPGQALLYESASCSHGRNATFEGKFYRNFYVHFKLRHWEYAPS